MSTITVEGRIVSNGAITIPYYGAWVADVDLPVQDPALPSSVSLVIADLTLRGTVVRQAGFAGGRKARIVAGGGGWDRTIPAKGYAHVSGIKLSTILNDAAREAGESIVIDSDRTLGLNYGREECVASALLKLLIGEAWWIDEAGVTQTKARASTAVVAPFTLVTRDGSTDQFEIATESIAGWLPGRTFTSPTVTDARTISSITIKAGNDGKLRLHVLSTSVVIERLRQSIRALIRSELVALSYTTTWDYTVAASTGMPGTSSTVDATPLAGSPMPPLTKVPLAVGLGVVTPPLTGTPCRIRFVNADPAKPEVISLGATTEHVATIEAVALLVYNFMATLMAAAGGGPLLALVLQPLMGTAMTAALSAQAAPAAPGLTAQVAAAAALQAGFAAGVTPSPAMFAAWTAAISGLSAKTLNVSGAFPSVGVPNG